MKLRIAIWLDEMALPFDEGLDLAVELGSEYVWFSRLPGETAITAMTDAEVEAMARRVDDRGLKLFTICTAYSFHNVRLTDLTPGRMLEHSAFRSDYDAIVRSLEIAARLGVEGASAHALLWPGEWSGWGRSWPYSPGWPMRWATQGGIISEAEIEGLVEVFSMLLEEAEKHGVDLIVNQRPFHYTNTTGHFRELAERLGSDRFKVMWGPADNVLSGERETASTGFANVSPYLAALHLKDVQVHDGHGGDYTWKPIGEGEVGYSTVFRKLLEAGSDAVLAVATHFLPPGSDSRVDAMRINYARVTGLLDQVQREIAADADA